MKINHLLKDTRNSTTLSSDDFMADVQKISQACVDQLKQSRCHQRMIAREASVADCSIPKRYQKASLESFLDCQREAYAVGRTFVDGGSIGMLMTGDVGTGKTQMACAIGNSLVELGKSIAYCTIHEAVMMTKATWSDSSVSEQDVFNKLTTPDLLILDEVGDQAKSEYERVLISSIIDRRSSQCKLTIAISNYSPAEVERILGRKAFDRLMGWNGLFVEMTGKSLRI